MTAKTRAIPSLHRDHFLAEVSGPARCSRRVTQPTFHCRAVSLHSPYRFDFQLNPQDNDPIKI